jgi:MFS family permease
VSIRQGFDGDAEPHEKISTKRLQFYIWFLFFNHISAQWQTYRRLAWCCNPIIVFVYLASGDDPYYNMRKDLDMTDERYALVKGTVFTLINSIFGLLFGYLADSFNRKWILVITTVAYTLMTLASAYVHTFVQVLIPRILFSFFMAACIPVSVSLINDYFSHEWRGRANSMFAFGIYLGGGLSSLTVLVNEKFG